MEFNTSRRQLLKTVGAVSMLGLGTQSASASGHHAYREIDNDWVATAKAEYYGSHPSNSDGDLWPSCWADNGALYTANGDGAGFFGLGWSDIAMNEVWGTPWDGFSGQALAVGDDLGNVWADPDNYNRKPTGMAAVDGNGDGNDELYLAYQNLHHNFDDAPVASISKSTDYGQTWQQTANPMFDNHEFTTIFFLDFGQSYANESVLAPENQGYLYAYGMDYNWRASYADTVPDPVRLFLARVPQSSVMDRSTWEFFTGTDSSGNPTWDPNIANKTPVLYDDRLVYQNNTQSDGPSGGDPLTVISQGSVVYNAPLDRYIYTSWTEYTWEFYEAPEPWGPWNLFYRQDFGGYLWHGTNDPDCGGPKNGGYATTIPSKFISSDGKSMWVQSNWFENVACGDNTYNFNFRQFDIELWNPTSPSNVRSNFDNLATKPGTVPVEKTAHYGHDEYYNSGNLSQSEDSWDGTAKAWDFWGYTWNQEYSMNRVVYTTGEMFTDGGWFTDPAEGIHVQVRQNHDWVDVTGLVDHDGYPYDSSAGPNNTYTFSFDDISGDGVRIIGRPGGSANFTSISELDVYFTVDDGRYELTNQNSGKVAEVGGAGTANGDNVIQWDSNGGAWQHWDINHVGNGEYSIINVNSGKAMEVDGYGTSNGDNIIQWDYHGGANQLWNVEHVTNGYYRIINVNSGKALEVDGYGTSNGDNLIQWDYHGGENQLWDLGPI